MARRSQWRRRFDRANKWVLAAVGTLFIGAIGTIFAFLLADVKENLTRPEGVEATVTRDGGAASRFLFPTSIQALPPPPETETDGGPRCHTREWAEQHGGIDAGESTFLIYLEGLSDRTVVLDGVEVVIRERQEPLRGVETACVSAAFLPTRSLDVDLDKQTVDYFRGPSPEAPRREQLHAFGRRQRASHFRFTLPQGEVEAFRVTALARQCSCSWALRFSYVERGERKHFDVTDQGEPFRTSGTARAVAVAWAAGAWRRLPPPIPPKLPDVP
jgi:hypothetical protein